MTSPIALISPKAYKDIEQIRDWYDERSTESADRFLYDLNVYVNKCLKNPEHYKKVSPKVRRYLLKRFPYIIFFSEIPTGIIILRVRHSKQKPLKRYN